MPVYRSLNHDFFKTWTSEMAYVLGFITADGNLNIGHRGNHYLEITSIDQEILEKIKISLDSSHAITSRKRNEKWQRAYRIQIGSKILVNDLIELGITPRKSKSLQLPKVPQRYFKDFLRGYFDGDGSVVYGDYKKRDRIKKSSVFSVRFVSGSKQFTKALQVQIVKLTGVHGSLTYRDRAWRLSYGTNASKKLFQFMYKKPKEDKNLIYLERKYTIFKHAGVA